MAFDFAHGMNLIENENWDYILTDYNLGDGFGTDILHAAVQKKLIVV